MMERRDNNDDESKDSRKRTEYWVLNQSTLQF